MSDTITLRRAFSETPLGRQMRRGRSRRRRSIPWNSFRRASYPESVLALASRQVVGLAIGEYVAVDQFSRIASALAMNGAPIDFVAAATEVPPDEIRHSEYALRFGGLLVGHELSLEVPRPPYEASFDKPVDQERLDFLMVEFPTINETLAAALLKECADIATDPVASAYYAAILADEVHHLRLGWYYLTWRCPQWTRAERQRVADHAARGVIDVERVFWQGRDAPAGAKSAAKALGVLDTKRQRAVIRRVMEKEIVPGLDALGLGASYAWRVRRRH